ncbi:MAG TPA: hypothetical protein DCE42_17325 [Myxococcales bacterium]|nr:hypothetical protein [Deltaproteobacteria bacterium]MBU53301.1 hypothetical protein [Deltaproteobacteria bacterium]HAA56531.1 hypothetical protein [Myxococcales bacterium]
MMSLFGGEKVRATIKGPFDLGFVVSFGHGRKGILRYPDIRLERKLVRPLSDDLFGVGDVVDLYIVSYVSETDTYILSEWTPEESLRRRLSLGDVVEVKVTAILEWGYVFVSLDDLVEGVLVARECIQDGMDRQLFPPIVGEESLEVGAVCSVRVYHKRNDAFCEFCLETPISIRGGA